MTRNLFAVSFRQRPAWLLTTKFPRTDTDNELALALTAARLDGDEVLDCGHRIKEVLLLSPTIFPLIFAAIMEDSSNILAST